MKIKLVSECLRIDSANAKAMIEGVIKNGKIIHQCIYCLAKPKKFPKLITLESSPTKYTLSRIGQDLRSDDYKMPFKYVACLEKEYFIKNDIHLWNIVCKNGLFDIWEPEAPYQRYKGSKLHPKGFNIALLRIYEIDRVFTDDDIRKTVFFHHIKSDDLLVELVHPLVSDEEFQNTKSLLEKSIMGYETTPIGPSASPRNNGVRVTHRSGGNILTKGIRERELENFLCERPQLIEDGLILMKRQYGILIDGRPRRIDMLCKDKNENLVVVELKKYNAPSYSIIDQIATYMGCIENDQANQGQTVRGIIVVGKADEGLKYAVKVIPHLTVKEFQVTIK
ncbi:MAG: DUF1016 family protein [Candidatus Saganbacteria bacterium]|nr:DUF1016 family protein [Candidatus Saganbacteria bacterium]